MPAGPPSTWHDNDVHLEWAPIAFGKAQHQSVKICSCQVLLAFSMPAEHDALSNEAE